MPHTLEQIITATCTATGTKPRQLAAKKPRSTAKVYAAKLIVTLLCHELKAGTNNERLQALGYAGTDTKALRYNLTKAKDLIGNKDKYITDPLTQARFILSQSVNGGDFTRATTKHDTKGGAIISIAAGHDEVIKQACISKGIYPLHVRCGATMIPAFIVGAKGEYVGQSENAYKREIKSHSATHQMQAS